jgi:ribosomal protein L37E
MSGYVSSKHDPPQVLTVVAITCRQCGGEETYHDERGRLNACHICENGYEKVMVPAWELQMAIQVQFDDPEELHATIVRLAERDNVRLPVLTHNTANLATHLHPTKPRIPLQNIPDIKPK